MIKRLVNNNIASLMESDRTPEQAETNKTRDCYLENVAAVQEI
jgi:hypothetical protein